MNCDILVNVELDRIDWTKVEEASGSAASIPLAFRSLLMATNLEEIKRAYWKLENHVVVQGRLYEAAAYIVPAICASLAQPDRPLLVRTWVLELLFQICNGYYVEDGPSTANADIVARCKNTSRRSLWLLYGELVKQQVKITENIIKLLEDDAERLSLITKSIPNYKAPVWTTGGQG